MQIKISSSWAPNDTARRERTPSRPRQEPVPGERARGTPGNRRSRALCLPTPHARGYGARGARAVGGACAREDWRLAPAGGRVLSRACARRASSLTFPALRIPSPSGARAFRPRARSLSVSRRRAHTPRGASATAAVSAAALFDPSAPRSSPPSSATPLSLPALRSHQVRGESLAARQAGLRRGLEKWRCRAWIMPSTAPPAPVRR